MEKGIHLKDYKKIVGVQQIKEIRKRAAQLSHVKVLRVYSFPHIQKMILNLVLLMEDAGIKTEWKMIRSYAFKKPGRKTGHLKENPPAKGIFDEYDFCFIHGIQPIALVAFRTENPKWIWRCHGDFPRYWKEFPERISPYIHLYDAVIAARDAVLKNVYTNPIFCMYPSINPFSDTNKPLTTSELYSVAEKYNIDMDRPVIVQISRFEPLKNQVKAITVYHCVRENTPVQLVLAGDVITEYPVSVNYWKKVKSLAEPEDIHLVENPHATEINAFQRMADVVIQPSLQEGFGLTISEALWKGTPVVASNKGGIPLQIEDSITSFLAETPAEYAEKIMYLLQNKDIAEKMGEAGKKFVTENLMITRHVLDYLTLMQRMKPP